MAIRFSCPSCRQPIEVDDQWANHSVGCPYCNRVVQAPQASSWPADDVPLATPAQGAATPSSAQPSGRSLPTAHMSASWTPGQTVQSSSAPWALTLALAGVVLGILAFIIWAGTIIGVAMEHLPANPSEPEMQRALQELVQSGQLPTSPASTVTAIVGIVCSLAAVIVAIRSMIRAESKRWMAIVGIIFGLLFLVCQAFLLLTFSSQALIAQPTTMPG